MNKSLQYSALTSAAAALCFAACSSAQSRPEPAPGLDGTKEPVTTAGAHAPAPKTTRPADKNVDPEKKPSAEKPGDANALGPPTLESFAALETEMPTGIAVSRAGRVFLTFPRWGDLVPSTLAELKGGRPEAYPPRAEGEKDPFVSVQSVIVDAKNRLWALDTGSVEMGPPDVKSARLIAFDLSNNKIIQTINFPASVVLPTTYLNDVRIDYGHGRAGTAFITDSSSKGKNAIIVVDLATGKSWRRLEDHFSTKPDPWFEAKVEGKPVRVHIPGLPTQPLTVGSDGIALAREYLYYSALAGRMLYRVSLDALADPRSTDAKIIETLTSFERDFASDGLEADSQGRIYLTDWEHGAVKRMNPAATSGDEEDTPDYEILAEGKDMQWPDTLALAADGYLYFTNSQLHRMRRFSGAGDLRNPPYRIFRVYVGATPPAVEEITKKTPKNSRRDDHDSIYFAGFAV